MQRERDEALADLVKRNQRVEDLLAEIERLKAEVRGASGAYREAIASNDRMLRERDAALLQIGDAKKLLDEFTTDIRVCQTISKDCSGGDSCKCLYCRARSLSFHMDSGTSDKPKSARPIEEELAELAKKVPPEEWEKVKPKIEDLLDKSEKPVGPMPTLDGPEPELTPKDRAALAALYCPVCRFPGMRDGACVFSDLHKGQTEKRKCACSCHKVNKSHSSCSACECA